MSIDTPQNRFVMNMQPRQCFARAKPFPTEKSQIKRGFFYFQKKPSALKKARISIKIWLQKSQIGNTVHNMVHAFAWKQVKRNVSRTVKWSELRQKNSLSDFEILQKTKIVV